MATSETPTTTPTKELVLQSGSYQCMIDVSATDTMADVRAKALDEFDDDMLPNRSPDFFISIGQIRLSKKQEHKKLAWDVLSAGRSVSLHAYKAAPKRSLSSSQATNQEESSFKKARGPGSSTTEENHSSTSTSYVTPGETVISNASTEESESQSQSDPNNPARKLSYEMPKGDTPGTGGSEATVEEAATKTPLAETNQNSPPIASTVSEDNTYNAVENQGKDGQETASVEMKEIIPTGSNEESTTTKTTPMAVDEENVSASGMEDHSSVARKDSPTTNRATTTTDLEEVPVVETPPAVDPHFKLDEAVSQSVDLLKKLEILLLDHENKLFCSEARRQEWVKEISSALDKSVPETVMAVLGSTGVGKSSLLNALLAEANILPTSGSRGCTAAVVELRFNKDFLEPKIDQTTTVYKGQVELISMKDWLDELKVLLDECSTNDTKTVYARPPEDQRQPDAAAAWAKINQVYGRGTMEAYTGKAKSYVWDRLSRNQRVVRLLTTENGDANTILVEEGRVDADQAQLLLGQLSTLKGKLRRLQKKWAKDFRAKINDYVYRKGNGGEPQTWPLIRKVVLHGPWNVLATGACLVDLPGVRDSNAARARVAQTYLQNCDAIWVVAPIKRAVDDGTAKELLGEQFKRRLLMDGQYGNVSFICTQTDDCETTEIMRDHEDVARLVPGRWEQMTSARDIIAGLEKELSEYFHQEDNLKVELEEADQSVKDLREEIKDARADSETTITIDAENDEAGDNNVVQVLEKELKEKKQLTSAILSKLDDFRKANKEKVEAMETKSLAVQKRLKAMSALVRNEYSTKCLQEDFRAGLEEMTKPADEMQDGTTENPPPPLPDDFELQVHCVASNDYLKIQKIKPTSDGPPNTFATVQDTHIPSLRLAVHNTTARFRTTFTTTFVNTASDFLDRVKLCAAEDREDSASGHLFQKAFETEMKAVESKIVPIVSTFIRTAEEKVNKTLHPSLNTGAAKGSRAALQTVTSWGSKNRRSRQFRSPEQNGLFWSTYGAVARRSGSYVSGSAGEVDFNQELCDPMEKEFSSDWQQIMDGAIRGYLASAERKVNELFAGLSNDVATAFARAGMESSRLNTMANTAKRTCTTALKTAFMEMRSTASDIQRDLNRSLLPKVTARMEPGYAATVGVPGGSGKFARMKEALQIHAGTVVHSMFSEATQELLKAISGLIKQLASMIQATGPLMYKSLASVYSVCWEDQQNQFQLVDPVVQEKMRACRNKLLPDLARLRQAQDGALVLIGIEREEEEFELCRVDTWEDRNAKKMNAAKENGNFVDLLDSDDSDSDDIYVAPVGHYAKARVKAELG